jgi:hypothetical protein
MTSRTRREKIDVLKKAIAKLVNGTWLEKERKAA